MSDEQIKKLALHSTMVLLKSDAEIQHQDARIPLHSIMVLLKLQNDQLKNFQVCALHSIMVLLKYCVQFCFKFYIPLWYY